MKTASIPEWVYRVEPKNTLFRDRPYEIMKRAFDTLVILATMPVVLPVLALCALAIYMEDPEGPVLYTRLRTGKGGHLFPMFKFRTMVTNAEALKEKYAHLNELQWPDYKITNDPRVTKVGKILRKTSLDELPQLINVLKGEMSLVGPRPTDFGSKDYQPWHTQRFEVLPGITGLWQIVARGASDFDDRLRLDIAYVNRRCLLMDFLILFLTVPAVLGGKGTH